RDDKGVTHRLWKWSDPEARKLLTGVLRAEDVLIADGHHRYETAWNYAQERAGADRADNTRRRAYRYVMNFLCPPAEPGLVIQPTLRAIRWQAPWPEWERRIEPYFKMQRMSALTALLSRLRQRREHTALGLVVEGGGLFWLKPKSDDIALPVVPLH